MGGTKGIGRNIVQLLSEYNVFVIARSTSDLPESDNVHFIEGDVEKAIDTSALPEIIDGLVYCPGSINLKPFHRLQADDFLRDWQINFLGAVNIIQSLLANLNKAEKPGIVLFSTVAVRTGMAFHSSIASAKGAVEGLTRSLAAEFAPKIRVNCIAPSLTQTTLSEKLLNTPDKTDGAAKRHPLQRIGQTADIAELACFLLSDKAGWITGQVVHVDGGLSALKV